MHYLSDKGTKLLSMSGRDDLLPGSSVRSRAPGASSSVTRRVMQANVGHETSAEARIRRALRERGLDFLEDARPVPGIRCEADLVVPSAKVCTFVDGCFWHRCPTHFRLPKTNRPWWDEKTRETTRRDRCQERLLRRSGWHVCRVWEHQTKGLGLERAANRLLRLCLRWSLAVF